MSGAFFETFVISEILKSFSNCGMDYRFIIEQDGVLYPVEIKQNSKVTAEVTSAFQVLDQIPDKKRGMGAVICMCPMPGQLRENVLQLPYWYI